MRDIRKCLHTIEKRLHIGEKVCVINGIEKKIEVSADEYDKFIKRLRDILKK